MSRRIVGSLFALALAGGAFFAGRASSDEPPTGGTAAKPPSMDEMMKEWAKLKAPGPQHELLKTFEGNWLGTGAWTDAGMTIKFTETVAGKMIFGGRFWQGDIKVTTEAAAGMPAMTSAATIFLGYDNATQKFVHAMIGEWSTSIATSEGTYDEGTKSFTMTGTESMGPGKERKYRMVHKIVSNDEWTLRMYFTGPDGKEMDSGGGVFKRK